MARSRINITGAAVSVDEDVVTKLAAVTTLITALAAARVTASESNSTVTTAVTAVQTAVTAFSTNAGPDVVVDINLSNITTVNALEEAFRRVVRGFRTRGLA